MAKKKSNNKTKKRKNEIKFTKSQKHKMVSYVEYRNRKILFALILLGIYGLLMVYSTTAVQAVQGTNGDTFGMLKRQAEFMALGFVVVIFFPKVKYEWIFKIAPLIYVIGLGCIFALKTSLGVESHGATRWLLIGGVQFQVAEVVKIAVIIQLAAYAQKHNKEIMDIKQTVCMWAIGFIPAGLIYKLSKDLSSALIVVAITFCTSFIVCRTWKLHILTGVAGCFGAFLWIKSIASNLPTPEAMEDLPFRTQRIAAWLDPERYAGGKGYQTLQALYAIGSGGLFGKGIGGSIQKISAIPESQNDMIFSIICEELGVIGGSMLLFLFGYLLYQIYQVAVRANTIFASSIAIGVFVHIASQVIVNVAVNLNVFPNTGLALPFISYGGTAVFLTLCEMALVMAIERKARMVEYRELIKEFGVDAF